MRASPPLDVVLQSFVGRDRGAGVRGVLSVRNILHDQANAVVNFSVLLHVSVLSVVCSCSCSWSCLQVNMLTCIHTCQDNFCYMFCCSSIDATH